MEPRLALGDAFLLRVFLLLLLVLHCLFLNKKSNPPENKNINNLKPNFFFVWGYILNVTLAGSSLESGS